MTYKSALTRRFTWVAVLATTACVTVAAPAQAARAPRYSLGNTDCALSPIGGVLYGFLTYHPTVYAIDATRRRDLQYVTARSDLYRWNGSTWALWSQGTAYTGLATDNNYVTVFSAPNGSRSRLEERDMFGIQTGGLFRVLQTITWHAGGAVPGYSVRSWLRHYPGAANNAYCVVT